MGSVFKNIQTLTILSVSTLSLWYELSPPLAWMIVLICPSLHPCFPMIYYQHSVLSNVFNMSIWSCSLPVKILSDAPFRTVKAKSLTVVYQAFCDPILSPTLSDFIPTTLISSLFTLAHFLEKSQAHSHVSTCSVGNHVTDFTHLQQVLTQNSLHQWGIIQF